MTTGSAPIVTGEAGLEPYYEDEAVTIYHGDCREVLPGLDPVETCITDPPYGLAFMGKAWDHAVPDASYWSLVREAILPGGFLLAFGGTRLWHWLAVGIERGGWEVRDTLMWLYGSGFPKSLDIGKSIDKARTEDEPRVREVCRFLRAGMDAAGVVSRDLAGAFGCHPRLIDHWAARDTDSQPSLPTRDQFERMKLILGLGDGFDRLFAELDARKGERSDDWKRAEVVGEYEGVPGGLGGKRFTYDDKAIRAPATEAAQLWDGWGTALKPAWEPIVLAMKPLSGTFATNAVEHGVAGLDVEGGRIGTEVLPEARAGDARLGTFERSDMVTPERVGRWPANLALDSDAAALLDTEAAHAGAPSRFFYTGKATRRDRGEGNDHPTVKPSALMRWLCMLTRTPTGGAVLDPFMGSGTTVFAAKESGRKAIGIDLDEASCEIAARRLAQGTLGL